MRPKFRSQLYHGTCQQRPTALEPVSDSPGNSPRGAPPWQLWDAVQGLISGLEPRESHVATPPRPRSLVAAHGTAAATLLQLLNPLRVLLACSLVKTAAMATIWSLVANWLVPIPLGLFLLTSLPLPR